MKQSGNKLKELAAYARLMRLDKPIGILLLLWPTLWALWLASSGQPSLLLITVFVVGVILMRSAGCIINDVWDRPFDGHVKRTKSRPLVSGDVSLRGALILFFSLMGAAFCLVLLCNPLTIALSFVGALLAVIYPLLKRVTHLPQFGLGLAFAWGVPMAFAATTNNIPMAAWSIFAVAVVWPFMYDTLYAMTDREDDLKIGVKSTAILFAEYDRFIIGILQIVIILLFILIGQQFQLATLYYSSVAIASIFFFYQQWLIRDRSPAFCFKAFLNNHWVGMIIFLGIGLNYL